MRTSTPDGRRSCLPRRLARVSVAVAAVLGAGLLVPAASGAAAPAQRPTAALPAWRNVVDEGFGGTTLPAGWQPYDGRPRTGSASRWSPERVQVGGGVLTLSAVRGHDGTWTTGGVGAYGLARSYERVSARIRFGAGRGVWAAALLWPLHGWPPEVDYWEIFGGDPARHVMTATTHWGRRNAMQHFATPGNFQSWHVISVVWTPTSLTYLVDGRVIGGTTGRARVPHQPMWPAFQLVTGVGRGQTPTAATPRVVRMQVDWIRIAVRG